MFGLTTSDSEVLYLHIMSTMKSRLSLTQKSALYRPETLRQKAFSDTFGPFRFDLATKFVPLFGRKAPHAKEVNDGPSRNWQLSENQF